MEDWITSRAGADYRALVRCPVAWPHHPILTVARQEDGYTVQGVLVDDPGSPRWRVFYLRPKTALRLVGTPGLGEYLSEMCLYVDYRSPYALCDDGWEVV